MTPSPPTTTPILVTGAHRSGSTWVGRMLALDPSVVYIHEPFNPLTDPGICPITFEHWLTYVCKDNEAAYRDGLRRTLQLRYQFGRGLGSVPGWIDRAARLRKGLRWMRYRLQGRRPLIKDPIALFSAEWLAQQFQMQVVVLIRHPAAFAGSLKVKGWTFGFDQLLAQPLLMRDWLEPYRDQLEAYQAGRPDLIDQAALVWRIMYGTVLTYRRRHPDWLFLRHEDLSRQPVPRFRRLFERLGLHFTPRVQRAIQRHSSASVPSEFHRDSTANIQAWKQRLSPDEIERLRTATRPLADTFYDPSEW